MNDLPKLGVALENIPFSTKAYRVHEAHEGLSLIIEHRTEGDLYLEVWLDCSSDRTVDRMICLKTTRQALDSYLDRKTPLRDIFTAVENGVMLDYWVNEQGVQEIDVWQVSLSDLPPDYFPQPGALHAGS